MSTRDVRRVNELTRSDIEWIPDRRVGEGPIRGRDKVIEFFTDRGSVFGEIDLELEQIWDRDDQVLVFLRVTGADPRAAQDSRSESPTCGRCGTGCSFAVRDSATATKPSKPPGCGSRAAPGVWSSENRSLFQ
jgi:SnoaL-like domain